MTGIYFSGTGNTKYCVSRFLEYYYNDSEIELYSMEEDRSIEKLQESSDIVLEFPIWHGKAPRIISTFLESYDFAGKTIVPFGTSHSSGIGMSAEDLHTLCSDEAEWKKGMRFDIGTSKEAVESIEHVLFQ